MSARIANRMRGIITSALRAMHGWSLYGAMVAQLDTLVQRMTDAVRESLIAVCDDDALEAHARNSNDRRANIETLAQLRAYLLTRWDRKKEAGTDDGLRFQLKRIGYPVVDLVCERDLREGGITGAFGGNVGFAFVVLHLPNSILPAGPWGDDGDWDGGALWGTGLTDSQYQELVYTLQKWKPAGVSFRFLIVDVDGTTTWDGTGFHGNYISVPINEPWEYITGTPLLPSYNVDYLTP